MRRFRNMESPRSTPAGKTGRVGMSGMKAEEQYLGSSGETPKAKRAKTADEAERAYMGEAYKKEKPAKKKERLPGRIVAFNPEEQFVTTKEANHFIAAKYKEMQNALEDAMSDRDEMETSGIPASKADQIFQEKVALINAEEGRLRLLAKEVNEMLSTPEAREAVYEGSENLVENPFFNPQSEKLAEVESGVEDMKYDLEGGRDELKELQAKWKQLSGQLNNVMMQLRGTSARYKMAESGAKAEAKKREEIPSETKEGKKLVSYPEMLPKDIGKSIERDAYLRQAEQFVEQASAEKREKGYADKLHYLMTEMEELSDQIEAKQMQVTFAEKRMSADRAA